MIALESGAKHIVPALQNMRGKEQEIAIKCKTSQCSLGAFWITQMTCKYRRRHNEHEGKIRHWTTSLSTLLPVAPGGQHAAHEHQQEGHVGDPHDQHHGVQTQDGPGGGRHRGHRRGSAGRGAVLAGAGPRVVLQGVGAGPRLVVHGGEARLWPICPEGKEKQGANALVLVCGWSRRCDFLRCSCGRVVQQSEPPYRSRACQQQPQ